MVLLKKWTLVLGLLLVFGLSACGKEKETTTTSSTSTEKDIVITLDQVVDQFKKTYPNATPTSIELEKESGTFWYSIEGVDQSNEYEGKMNAEQKDASIVNAKQEKLDSDEQNGVKLNDDKLDLVDPVSVIDAATTAKEHAKGAIESWKMEQEGGSTYWEVTVKNKAKETTVHIEAQTGEVLAVEVDND